MKRALAYEPPSKSKEVSNSEQPGLRRIAHTVSSYTYWRGCVSGDGAKRRLQTMARDVQNGTILIVDDNFDVRAFAQAFLENGGYAVVTAADGQEGLRRYKIHRSSVVLLLTDVSMPKMNGLQLADRILDLDSHLPVLFMSGDAWSADRGFGCIVKPFNAVELVARVNQILDVKARFRAIAGAGRSRSLPACHQRVTALYGCVATDGYTPARMNQAPSGSKRGSFTSRTISRCARLKRTLGHRRGRQTTRSYRTVTS